MSDHELHPLGQPITPGMSSYMTASGAAGARPAPGERERAIQADLDAPPCDRCAKAKFGGADPASCRDCAALRVDAVLSALPGAAASGRGDERLMESDALDDRAHGFLRGGNEPREVPTAPIALNRATLARAMYECDFYGLGCGQKNEVDRVLANLRRAGAGASQPADPECRCPYICGVHMGRGAASGDTGASHE